MRPLSLMFTLTLLFSIISFNKSFAQIAYDLSLDDIDVSIVPDPPSVKKPKGSNNRQDLKTDPGQVVTVANDLVALGERVWTLFENGRPTTSVDLNPISVLPKVDRTNMYVALDDMYGWSDPVTPVSYTHLDVYKRQVL